MARSPIDVGEDVASTMKAVQKALDDSTKKALREVANGARSQLMRRAGEVPGGDRRFSNMAGYNHGGRLNVTTRVRAQSIFVGSKGPWKLAETGADPHRLRGGHHPGTDQGRRSWSVGEREALSDVERDFPAAVEAAVERAFARG